MTSTVVRGVTHAGTVAIVGGGCSGVLTARALLRNTTWRTVLISPDDRPGCGVAYGAAQPWHVLNSRAAAMSADSDDPHHLVRWCRDRGLPVEPTDFLPRKLYGDYLADQFARTTAAAGPRSARHAATAATIRRVDGGHVVTDESGATVHAGHVVLTVGNPPPRRPPGVTDEAHRDPAFIADPWAPGALDTIPADAPVLLLGTGLTAVDVALSLTAGGRRTAVEALSRRADRRRRRPGAAVVRSGRHVHRARPAARGGVPAARRDAARRAGERGAARAGHRRRRGDGCGRPPRSRRSAVRWTG